MADGTEGGPSAGGDRAAATAAETAALEPDAPAAFSPLMARIDVAVAAIIALIAATLTVAMPHLIASGGIDTERDFATLSPVLIPRLAFGLLTVLAIFALIQAVQAVRARLGEPRPDEPSRFQRAGVATLIAVAYAACVTWLGYILATMLMTAAMAYYLGLRNPLSFIPGVIVIPTLIRFVFERMLLISLPRSSIESIGAVEDAVLRSLAHIFLG
ncbi:MAG: tripartite tricarboxylate transporter TctB family protein [Xanthobacteraceae bacterium]